MIEGVSSCSVSVSTEGGERDVIINHADFGAQNATKSLMFGGDISIALDEHGPNQVWWATMTSEERCRLKLFQEGAYLRYMAHCRYYAKLALKGMGDKETLEAVKDYVVILFSKEKTALAKSLFQAIWWGHLLAEHQTVTAAKKAHESMIPEVKAATQEKFRVAMYSWEVDKHITYDDMMETEIEISKNVEVLKAITDAYEQRGVLLSSFAADRRAEITASGNNHLNTMRKNIADRAAPSLRT